MIAIQLLTNDVKASVVDYKNAIIRERAYLEKRRYLEELFNFDRLALISNKKFLDCRISFSQIF